MPGCRSRLWYCLLLAAFLGVIPSRASRAQFDVRAVLMQVILQLQTGNPNPSWYGAQLWQTIALQTGNTGVYPWLVQLGVVQNVTLLQQEPLPSGMLYLLTAQHQNGTSNWILGISTLTGRIEYATAEMGASGQSLPNPQAPPQLQPQTQTQPQLQPSQQPLPSDNPPPNPAPAPSDNSEACKKFPNLC
jgi:hypothetical protein